MYLSSYCRGCGARLQSKDPYKPGYVPVEVLGREDIRCQRCYRILHYGQREEGGGEREEYLAAIRRGIREGDLVVKVFDLVDFEGSWSEEIDSLAGNKPLLAVLNKIDLLPKQVKRAEIEEWAAKRLMALDRETADVVSVSSTRGWGIRRLLAKIGDLAGKGRRAVLVGATNVGKSSLLNALRRQAREGGRKVRPIRQVPLGLTTSPYPGTTQDMVRVDLPGAGYLLIDTPGLAQSGRLSDLLCPACGRRLIPAGELSRKTFKLSPGQSLLLGGLARFALGGNGQRPILLAFASREVIFHTTSSKKAARIMAEHSGDWLVPPCPECRVKEWEQVALTVQEDRDVVIPGLGWVSIRRGPAPLEVTVPAGVKVVERPALVGPPK